MKAVEKPFRWIAVAVVVAGATLFVSPSSVRAEEAEDDMEAHKAITIEFNVEVDEKITLITEDTLSDKIEAELEEHGFTAEEDDDDADDAAGDNDAKEIELNVSLESDDDGEGWTLTLEWEDDADGDAADEEADDEADADFDEVDNLDEAVTSAVDEFIADIDHEEEEEGDEEEDEEDAA